MPIDYVRRLTGRKRTTASNRHLGFALAFVAGATNAGGFLAVQQYTSHMTGIVSAMADNLALGGYALVWPGAGALLSFVAGRRLLRGDDQPCAAPANAQRVRAAAAGRGVPPAVLRRARRLAVAASTGRSFRRPSCCCASSWACRTPSSPRFRRAEIRTTHITGIVTDIGIELGKLFYWNAAGVPQQHRVTADRNRLRMLLLLAASFFCGGVAGALGFRHVGYLSTLPLAAVLIALAGVPAVDDLIVLSRRRARKRSV